MPFTITRVSNYGTTHPVVARLVVQTHDILQWADLSKEKRHRICGIYDRMKNRLIKCQEARHRLSNALEETLGVNHFNPDGTLKSRPHLIGLDNELETILYEQKNYLRDLVGVINLFFETEFDEASAFHAPRTGGDGKLTEWAKRTFGPDDPFSEMLAFEQGWIGEVIRKRNAVEHPGGYSGTLHIINIEQGPDGRFVLPVWHRDDLEPFGIFPDLEVLLDNMLTLAEDILVSCVVHKGKNGKMINFFEVPEQERSPNCPTRIKVALSETFRKQPQVAQNNSQTDSL